MLREQDLVAEIPRLRRYARALTGEPALGKWTLWRPGNLGAWLRTVMHNLFINQLHARPGTEGLEEAVALPVRPHQQDMLEVRDLDRALQRLAPEQREVLVLVGLEEVSYSEAARITGVPVGTVMSRLSRARERLRQVLAAADAPPLLKRIK